MTTVQEIEKAVINLSKDDLSSFRDWFLEYDAAVWDRKFEEDVVSGRLDRFAAKALAELRLGKCTDL
jgi:hypothetical protein